MKTEKFNNVTLEISNEGKLAIKEKDVASDNDFQKFLSRSLGLLERFSFLLYCVICSFSPSIMRSARHYPLENG